MTEELKPCPFCGGEAKCNRVLEGVAIYHCYCTVCAADTKWYDTESKAIAAWNTHAERECGLVNIAAKGTHAPSNYMCSECGATSIAKFSTYCPHCGRKVREVRQ